MNGILSNQNSSDNKLHGVLCPKSSESVETAGSLAMGAGFSLFAVDCYDEFSSSNPFIVDYSQYSDCGDCVAYSGFLSDFSNAMSTIGSAGGECSASFSGDCGGCSCGGFTSVC
jgi:hypothetical protein